MKTLNSRATRLPIILLSLFILAACSSSGELSGKNVTSSVSSTGDSITSMKLSINDDGDLIATTTPILDSDGLPMGKDDIDKISVSVSAGESLTKLMAPKGSNVQYSLNTCSADIEFGSGKESSADIAFLVDTTGSMGSAVEGIINSIQTFAKSLSDAGVDAKYALVTLGDAYNTKKSTSSAYTLGSGADEPPTFDTEERPMLDFTDLDTFLSFANEVKEEIGSGAGGGDLPENYYGTVMAMANLRDGQSGLSNREGVPYYQILVGDDCSHTQEVPGGTSGKWVPDKKSDLSKLSGIVTVHVVRDPDTDSGYCSDDQLTLAEIADATGGAKLDLGDGNVDLSEIHLDEFIKNYWIIKFNSSCISTKSGTFYIKLILTVTRSNGTELSQTFTFTVTLS